MSPAETDVATLIVWMAGLLTIVNLGTAVWNIFSGPARKQEERAREQTKRVEQIELRCQRIEDRLGSIPTAEAMHELRLDLQRTRGELEVVIERLKPLAATMERFQEWMLENGR